MDTHNEKSSRALVISIVSHGQGNLIRSLLLDIALLDLSIFGSVLVVVTVNIPEDESYLECCSHDLVVFHNVRPLGYGANHNQAFSPFRSDFFLVLNPDLRITNFDFGLLVSGFVDNVGLVAPAVISVDGNLEDSCRRYPSLVRLLVRTLIRRRDPDYAVLVAPTSLPISVDWVGGMFMLFSSEVFVALRGFDIKYFMYLEDADICRRANWLGFNVHYLPSQAVIHDAQRRSFKSWEHARWHFRSMFRFLFGL